MKYIVQKNNLDKYIQSIEGENQLLFDFQNIEWTKNIDISVSSENKILLFIHDANINININICAEESKTDIYIICFSTNKSKILSQIKTKISSSYSVVNKYVLSLFTDNSKINLEANMDIGKNIKKSEWHLLQENIVLGKNIKSSSNPALNVFSSDIKASHGLKMQQLDPDKLFYLSSKNLSLEQSKTLFIQSYINTILDKFDSKILKENNIISENICTKILS